MKRIAKSPDASEAESVRKEYDLMLKVGGHPQILEAFNLFQDAKFFYIEMLYCEGGDFSTLKKRALAANVCLTEAWWVTVFKCCVEALSHIHSRDIVHCDVKEANLMVKNLDFCQPAVVLADFGISQIYDKTRDEKQSIIYGTPGYIPPDVWESKIWRPEGDVFSLGVVFAQMLMDRQHGIFIEGTDSLKEIKQATLTREPPFDLIREMRLKKLVMLLLDKNPATRPRAVEVCSLLDRMLLVVQLHKHAAQFKGTWEQLKSLLRNGREPLQHNDVLSEKNIVLEPRTIKICERQLSNSVSTVASLGSQSLSSSCSDC